MEGEAVEFVRQIEEGGVNVEGAWPWNGKRFLKRKCYMLHIRCGCVSFSLVFCLGHHLTGNPPT